MVSDYERIAQFTAEHLPQSVKDILHKVRVYLTDTLFVVIRSYALIMLLTFTELSILFSIFGIRQAVLKASLIELDWTILPMKPRARTIATEKKTAMNLPRPPLKAFRM